jgi:hypothetical protein
MTPDERINRSNRAQAIMADPIMVEAAEHIEAECWRLFKTLPPTDSEGLAQIKAIQYMHAKYQAFLKAALDDGKIARVEVEQKRLGLKDRLKGLVRG